MCDEWWTHGAEVHSLDHQGCIGENDRTNIFNLSHISKFIPEVITFSDYFSSLVTPISMTVLGMKLATISFTKIFKSTKLYYVSFLKLILFPIVIVAIILAFKNIISTTYFEGLVLGVFFAFAMPTAGLATTFADEFNGDTENAVVYTLGTTILSIITIPCIYWALNILI